MNFLGVRSRKPRWLPLAGVVVAMLATGALAASASAESSGGVGTGAAGGAQPGGGGTQPGGGGEAGGAGGANERVGTRYERIWDRTPAGDRRWARRTSECESGGNPDAIGGGGVYRGAFQFMRSTWKRSPKSPGGDPIAYPYRTQAVVAILLRERDGAGHWPVCG